MSEETNILGQYDLDVSEVKFLRHNENKVYLVTASEGRYILRIHENMTGVQADGLIKAGDKRQLIEAEMELLGYLYTNYFGYGQMPLKNKSGSYVTISADGNVATILSFVEGQGLNEPALYEEVPVEDVLKKFGECLAEMHAKMQRVEYDKYLNYGLPCAKRLQAELTVAKQKGYIADAHFQIMKEILDLLVLELEKHGKDLQIVHGDLSKSNLLYNQSAKVVIPIDFSMNGVCLREYDLASVMLHFERNGEAQKVLEAYEKVCERTPDRQLIQLCVCYQVIMFIAASHEAVHEQGWFGEAMNYWCEELMGKTLHGEAFCEEIGLYQE